MQKNSRWFSVAGLILIGVAVGIIFASNFHVITDSNAARKDNPGLVLGNQDEPDETLLQLQNTGKAFTYVSKQILPTVVSISTEKVIRRSPSQDDFFAPFFREFFGRRPSEGPETQRLQGLGSGVIVSKQGYILTNHHVIEGADDVTVTLYDQRQFEAEIVGSDPLTEVAVIKITGDDLPVTRLGNSDASEVGEWVLAVGNPLFLNSTVTAGIISAKGRDIGIIQDSDASDEGGSYAIENFIQTDAAINQGNSGGALVNLGGEVIGINTAIATRTGGYQGYGFAIPVNLAKKIMTDLIEQGYVTRAYVGIGMRPVNESVAERLGLDRPKGVYIDSVQPDSPGEDAGLKPLDVILKLDGKDILRGNQVQNEVALKNPGDVVVFTILRDGKEINLKVKLGQRDTGKEKSKKAEEEFASLGLTVRNLDEEIRSRLDIDDDARGVIVTDVEAGSAAEDAGIRVRDLIMKIEDETVESTGDYRRILKKYDSGEVVIFYIQRGRAELHAFVKLPK